MGAECGGDPPHPPFIRLRRAFPCAVHVGQVRKRFSLHQPHGRVRYTYHTMEFVTPTTRRSSLHLPHEELTLVESTGEAQKSNLDIRASEQVRFVESRKAEFRAGLPFVEGATKAEKVVCFFEQACGPAVYSTQKWTCPIRGSNP